MTTIKHSRRKMSTHWKGKSIFFQSTAKTGWQNKTKCEKCLWKKQKVTQKLRPLRFTCSSAPSSQLQLLFHNIKTRIITGMVKKYIFHTVKKKNHPSIKSGWFTRGKLRFCREQPPVFFQISIKLAEHTLKPKQGGWNFSIRVKTYVLV